MDFNPVGLCEPVVRFSGLLRIGLVEVVVVCGLEFLRGITSLQDAVDCAVNTYYGHSHALFVLGSQQTTVLVEFEVFPVLVDDAGMFSDELAGLVFLVVLCVAIHTLDLCFFD